MTTDNFRQTLAYLASGKSPLTDYVITYFGVGTGTTPPTVNDVNLVSPVLFSNGTYFKNINSILNDKPLSMTIIANLGNADCNGYLLTEIGFYTANYTLVARELIGTPINKTSLIAPPITYSIKF